GIVIYNVILLIAKRQTISFHGYVCTERFCHIHYFEVRHISVSRKVNSFFGGVADKKIAVAVVNLTARNTLIDFNVLCIFDLFLICITENNLQISETYNKN